MPDRQLTDLLASYGPQLIQKRVIHDPRPIETPVAEEMQAVLLFADISGFTGLTESFAERGLPGVEAVANLLNEYFGQLIEIIHEYRGDVVKFAGDAIIAVWPIENGLAPDPDTLRKWTVQVAACGQKIREKLHNYQVEHINLRLKIAVSAGVITYVHVGGVFNRWEFLVTGLPLVELGLANGFAQAGDVLIAPSAWEIIRADCVGTAIEFHLKDGTRPGARLERLNSPAPLLKRDALPDLPVESEASLKAYIPGAIINRLSAGHSGWIAELRKVTVLFINLPDVDEHTSLETAQTIARLIQRAVYRFEGSLNKINVDDKGITLVAALGLPPFSHENDPLRGVQAALMMRDELNDLGVRSYIGITSGRLFAGAIGNSHRREYTLIGNVVNLSARLMTVASKQRELIEKYRIPILIDHATAESVREGIDFEVLPPQQIKGRAELVEVFHPIAQKKSVIRPKADLIGRQQEKNILANALQELQRGAPLQVVILHGEAGIGKSRVTADVLRQAESLSITVLAGAGDSIEKINPYHAWRPVFNRLFELGENIMQPESSQENRDQILPQVVNRLEAIDPDLVKYAPLLDVVLPSVAADNDFTASMTGEIRGGNIRELLVRVIQHEASQKPLVIVIEDLHWLDSASWTLLADIHQKVRPILMVLNTRPFSPPVPQVFKEIVDRPETRFIKLDAMGLDEVEALVCQRLGVRSIPESVSKLVREKSEGHPFFAEELAYALRDSGIVVIENHECRLSSKFESLESLSLPDNLQAAITSRIDSLSPSQQLTLKVASVIGRIFAFRALEAVYPIDTDRPVLPNYLNTLTRLSLTLIESESPDLSYIFKHAITQEVAYNLMLYSQRRQLHHAVAEWIEHAYEKDIRSYYPLLAYHWTQAALLPETMQYADVVAKAIDYLEKAGEQATENNSNQEAIHFFTQALEWEAKLPKPDGKDAIQKAQIRRAHWHSRIGLAYYGLGLLAECNTHVQKALRLLNDPLPETNLQFTLALIPQIMQQTLHRFFPSRYIGRLKSEQERAVAIEIGRLNELMARIYFYSNETIPITYTILHFLNAVEPAGPSPELATAYGSMAVLAGFAQLHDLAEKYVELGLAIARQVNQPANLATVGVVTGAYKITVGKWDEVRAMMEETRAICEKLGDHRQWGDAMAMLGENAFMSGDLQYGLPVHSRLLEDARRRRSPLHQCWGLLGVGANKVRRGEAAEAVPMLEEAVKILDVTPNLASAVETTGQLALAYLRLGEDEKARVTAEKVLEMMGNSSPTVYSMDIGIASTAEVLFTLLEKSLREPDLRADSVPLRSSAEKALKLLRAFQGVFPIGQPHTALYEGQHAWLLGKTQQAVRHWNKSLEAAKKFRRPFEEGLARLKLGSVLETPLEVRREHLQRAIEIFEQMTAVHELGCAREAAAKAGV
ncbi:MAG: AAA family ATPase [Chloroflexota bacterium]